MKYSFIKTAIVISFFSISTFSAGQTMNPYIVLNDLQTNNAKYLSSGRDECGIAYSNHFGAITHKHNTKSLTLPTGASIKEVYAFMYNTGCMAGAGHNEKTTPWHHTFDTDMRFGMIHHYTTSVTGNGQQVVSVDFDNWSDCDARPVWLIVEYTQ
ncbi:MAG: hypothetical protein MUF75_03270 [Bacteroidia bacterium]|jgi:hypothetical protein|nr:hypothetical protein [Bacteroidia bacterium]